jgi:branched-subunit amino acid transport protein
MSDIEQLLVRWPIWALIFGAGLITLLMRASFLVFANPEAFPTWFRRSLAFVPPTVLTALVLPGLVFFPNTTSFDWKNPRLYAGLIALAICVRFKIAIWPLSAGMLSLWGLQWLINR